MSSVNKRCHPMTRGSEGCVCMCVCVCVCVCLSVCYYSCNIWFQISIGLHCYSHMLSLLLSLVSPNALVDFVWFILHLAVTWELSTKTSQLVNSISFTCVLFAVRSDS